MTTLTWIKKSSTVQAVDGLDAEIRKTKAGVVVTLGGEVFDTFPNVVAAKTAVEARAAKDGVTPAADADVIDIEAAMAARSLDLPADDPEVIEALAAAEASAGEAPAKKAPAVKKAPAAKAATHDACPECGFKFSTPKARCSTRSACEKRQAAAKAGASK